MKIGIANDHHGFLLKDKIVKYLEKQNIDVINYGSNNNESVDYPDYAFKVGEAIRDKKIDLGILICGSGIGMSIACNKVNNVRCARVSSIKDVYLSRLHNNSNVIALSSNISFTKVKKMINVFLNTKFSDEKRHHKRVEMIDKYEC